MAQEYGERDFTDKMVTELSPCKACGRLTHFVRQEAGEEDLCITIPKDDHPAPSGTTAFTNQYDERDFRKAE